MTHTTPRPQRPLFRAVASSTKPIQQLLRCINCTKKVHVEITEEGIKVVADQARVMQGVFSSVASLSKHLFTNYNLRSTDDDGEGIMSPSFQISLPAFLEMLNIFGAADAAARLAKADNEPYRSNLRNYRPDAFNNQLLGMSGTCALSYAEDGSPLSVTIEESGNTTACNLMTYVPETPEEIPFDRDDLGFKIIMQSSSLLAALIEMAPINPSKLTITVSKESPFLRLSSNSVLGGSSVDFSHGRDLLETFQCREDRWSESFKFDMIKSASEAMRIASKVSIRGDSAGVLSLQFMVETEGDNGLNFILFSFVPYITHDDDDDEDEDDEDGDVST